MALNVIKLGWAVLILLIVSLGLAQLYFIYSPGHYWQDLWLNREQQGHWYFKRAQYLKAASRFSSSEQKAKSLYAAEQFEAAEKLYAEQHSAQGYFNWGNALAHQEKYQQAILAYRLALLMQPGWPQAQDNLRLVQALIVKTKALDENNGGSQGELGADDIAFDLKEQKQSDMAQEDEMGIGELGQEQVQELWLRRLNTRPTDFLRRKFAFQYQQRSHSKPQADAEQEEPKGNRNDAH